jgi:hypothetical protein
MTPRMSPWEGFNVFLMVIMAFYAGAGNYRLVAVFAAAYAISTGLQIWFKPRN